MKITYLLISIVTIILSSQMLIAGNSILSYEGVPCQNFGNDIYGKSMGDVGLSDIFRKNTGFGNPAMIGNANLTLVSTGIMFGWTGYKSNYITEKSYRDNSLDFPFFSVVIPVNRHRYGFQLNSYSSGVTSNQTTVEVDSSFITEKQSINRYLFRADLMYAYNFRIINVGLGLNYFFGHDNRRFEQYGSYGIFNTREKVEATYKNPTGSIGITTKIDNFAIGAYYTKSSILKGESKRSSIHETEAPIQIKHSIPDHIAAGITTKLNNEFKISGDVHLDLWKNAEHTYNTENGLKLGIGFAHEPKAETKKTFWGQIPKRIGVSTRNLPFKINDNTIYETAVSTGLTLPIKQKDSQIDVGTQYIWRGDIEQHNLQDRSLMLMIGLTGFDIITRAFDRSSPRAVPKADDLMQ